MGWTDTTGKTNDQVEEGLWPYTLAAKTKSQVTRDMDSNWTMNTLSKGDGYILVWYYQDLHLTEFTRSTESVTIRAAWGSGLNLTQHGYGDYTDGWLELDLLTGESKFTAEDYTLEDVHGVLMWLSWAVLAPIGIMASAFRWLLPKGPIWFQVNLYIFYPHDFP